VFRPCAVLAYDTPAALERFSAMLNDPARWLNARAGGGLSGEFVSEQNVLIAPSSPSGRDVSGLSGSQIVPDDNAMRALTAARSLNPDNS
jgi:hypothetical protein